MPPFVVAIIAWYQTNGIALAGFLSSLIVFTAALQKFVDLFPNHQEADTWFGKILRAFEKIAGVLPAPGTRQMKRFTVRKGMNAVDINKAPPPGTPTGRGFGALWALLLLAIVATFAIGLSGCAGMTWNTPIFTAGPTVAPIEEINLKSASTATTAGFGECVGLGQFDAAGKNWDSLDLCVDEVGGIVNAAGTPGVLQVGPEIGTFNNIIGVGFLFTPYTADGQGFFQGGGPGFAVAGMFNVTAISAWLTGGNEGEEKMKVVQRLPRGGL